MAVGTKNEKGGASEGVDRRAMAVLSLGHLCSDATQVAVPALLPFLVREQGISYAAAGTLVLASTVASSVVQPLFGHFSDRRSFAALMPLGLALGALGIALVGLAPSFPLVLFAVVLSGLGVAAFHPESTRFAGLVSGERRATGMSVFSVGGNVGFALGPLLLTPLVLLFGLPGTLLFAVLPLAMAGAVAFELPRLRGFRSGPTADGAGRPVAPDLWGAFALLAGVISLRSVVQFGLIAFVPLYYSGVFASSEAVANAALSVALLSGAAGTLVGGRLADRHGRRAVLLGSLLVLPPLFACFLASGEIASMALLVPIGAATVASYSVTVVMGQEYLPGRMGVASGFTVGLAIGMGGVGAPLLGALADVYGLPAVMAVLAVLPIPAALLALRLPKQRSATPRRNPQARRFPVE
jgi:FSR family fosmidomycin resistance protein-like MFS transporter